MTLQIISKGPRCISCMRRVMRLGDSIGYPVGQQVRGKKKLAKIPTVHVQLLQNVPGYGRKGSIVPVTRGIMRNIWFPRKMAEYATASKLQALERENIVPERDPTFGSKQERKAAIATRSSSPAEVEAILDEKPAERVELPQLSPHEATIIISKLLPQNIDFYRTPILAESSKPEPAKRLSPSIPISSAISTAAAEGQRNEGDYIAQAKTSIYGSVSTADIAVNLQAALAETSNGVSIVLSPDNISFVEQVEERNRVKHLGSYDIEVRLSGAAKAIQRKITIKAQE